MGPFESKERLIQNGRVVFLDSDGPHSPHVEGAHPLFMLLGCRPRQRWMVRTMITMIITTRILLRHGVAVAHVSEGAHKVNVIHPRSDGSGIDTNQRLVTGHRFLFRSKSTSSFFPQGLPFIST